jgi:hypothetical protein
VPYRSEQWADEKIASTIAALPGRVFAPDLGGYVQRSVHGEQPLMGAVDEIRGGYGGRMSAEGVSWERQLDQALAERRFSYVILGELDCCLNGSVKAYGYTDMGPLVPPGDEFYTWRTLRTPALHLYAAPRD